MSLQRKMKKHAIAYVIVIYTIIIIICLYVFGDLFILPFVLCTIGFLCAVIMKLYVDTKDAKTANENNYNQLEALITLSSTLDLKAPLPLMRKWAASPDYLSLISREIIALKPTLIVELGSGVSTVIAASCLNKIGNGRIISFEQDALFIEKTRRNLRIHGLDGISQVIHAQIKDIELMGEKRKWYDISVIEIPDKIDMLIVDGPSLSGQSLKRYPAVPFFSSKLSDTAVVILDDAQRKDERHCVEQWLKEYPNMSCEYIESEKGAYVLKKI